MRCANIKELIMDYVDNELTGALQKEVRRHLDGCYQCRTLEIDLRNTAIEPLKKAQRAKAPQEVWDNIKAAIERTEERPRFVFQIRMPALAFATAAAVLLISLALVRGPFDGRYAINGYIEEQAEFLSYLIADNGAGYSDSAAIDFETTIEEFLL